ncbi:hypothetical protein PHYBLDRAFT_149756 [Phycomyces blakesleeanus NRRL 1555(-)]|uniref:Uncharacterized protein n=1 Tax=Phycomyces blakesleeanus (strain ATCC 8743b / DSM 1359 / FGSC 10004 / NBRC 33097 / NRRL 1555) TaxID=763407 RepID=A0A167L188_PHYB8|nr:hypothetical protein PHYBLDRAFT_149756 [Phycomyces blakesleeanus NRRL 1555(-)]OAD69358.1 hypothetical protein PHYBLDRAFT_149756 [Phycomyces blakesleeanus NRRL 1555(-)]|eukprot:XP_018287398.1 hypothetical protein PHYBLDRAFT_149756 [Phycomyces blakesleeanus NRRL 1555(-)]
MGKLQPSPTLKPDFQNPAHNMGGLPNHSLVIFNLTEFYVVPSFYVVATPDEELDKTFYRTDTTEKLALDHQLIFA